MKKHNGINWDAVMASLTLLVISFLVIAVIFVLTIIGVRTWLAGIRWPAIVEGALTVFGLFLYGYYQFKDL